MEVNVQGGPSGKGALGSLTQILEDWLQQIPATTLEASVQKSTVLETAKIQCRTFKLPGKTHEGWIYNYTKK